MARRRVVRIFKFDRVLLFIIFICFAVALTCVLLSIDTLPSGIAVGQRTVYIVTFDTCDTQAEAKLKSQECFSRGGGGNVFESESGFEVAASLHESRSNAEAVKARMENAKLIELTFPRVRLDESVYAKTAVEGLDICYYTVQDSLSKLLTELSEHTVSEAAAIKQCTLLSAEVERLYGLSSASASLSALSESERNAMASVVTVLGSAKDAFKECIDGDGAISARIRKVKVTVALSAAAFPKDFK